MFLMLAEVMRILSKGGGVPYRLKIRAPSFANLSILPKLLPGHYVSDVPAILGSIDYVLAEFSMTLHPDSANILTPHVGDANTRIPEFKAFLVNIAKA